MRLSQLKSASGRRKPNGRAKPARSRRVPKKKNGASTKASSWIYSKARSVRQRQRPRTIVIGIVSGFLSTIILGFWLSGHLGDVYATSIKFGENRLLAAGFGIDHIDIDGAIYSSEGEVRKVLGIENGELVFAVNLQEARSRVESLGWVKKASVTRLLPNRIAVVITERTPFAVWQHRSEFSLINANGSLISRITAKEYTNLPRVIGDGASTEAITLLTDLGTRKELVQKVRYVVRVSGRRWNLIFFSGAELLLPATGWGSSLDQVVASSDFMAMLELPNVILDTRVVGRIAVSKKPARAVSLKRIVS